MPAHPVRQILLGFLRLQILCHAKQEPVFGAWLTNELRRHGYDVSPGTLYPTLHALERAGFLVSWMDVVDGRRQRLYRTTKAGARGFLRESSRRAQALLAAIGQAVG